MAIKKDNEVEEFPLPPSCKVAWKVGKEWHTCNLPVGHKGPHECKHYRTDDKDEIYSAPKENAQRIMVVRE